MRLKSCRTLLQYYSTTPEILHSSMSSSSDPITSLQPMNASIATAIRRPFKLTVPFETSVALTILVLLAALFFIAFFSIYIRHFTADTTPSDDRPRRNSTHRFSQKGVDSSTMQSLPLISYGGSAKHLIEDCPICLTEFEVSELVRVIPFCRHVFHQECLDTWLSSHVTCPLCRSTQFFKKVDDDVVVVDVENGNGVIEGSTVVECDTCRNIRRSCSSSNLGSRVALHRSASF